MSGRHLINIPVTPHQKKITPNDPTVPAIDEHKVKKWTFSIFATPRCQEIMSAEPKT
eukprot:TRINITY_DN2499_c0_g1_i1.p2 TRINITY_DN2499_c0_g1~~TRINITY_DN2499_c0_g1_i1.p2  ORF type:complete len:57 (+),score=8.01 TRINITY_DN2499_c0_g1_i1:192-362(+)